jgi:hypothetical protein
MERGNMDKNPELLRARAEFVKMIKEENFYSDFSRQSLKQHWNGAASGFSNDMVQSRWRDFWAGWQREERRS